MALFVTFGCVFLYWAGIWVTALARRRPVTLKRPLIALLGLAVGTGLSWVVLWAIERDPRPSAANVVSAEQWIDGWCAAGERFLEASRPGVTLQDEVVELLQSGDTLGAREAMTRYFERVAVAADAYASDLAALGVPDVPGGEGLASEMTTVVARMADTYEQATDDIRTLSADDALTFLEGLDSVILRMDAATVPLQETTLRLMTEYSEASELDESFLENERCQAVRARFESGS